MPASVIYVIGVLAFHLLLNVVYIPANAFSGHFDNLSGSCFGAIIDLLLLLGVVTRNRLTWQWGRLITPLGGFAYVLVVVVLLFLLPKAEPWPAAACVVLAVLAFSLFFAFGSYSALQYFDLVCPECGACTHKADGFLFTAVRCLHCGHVWSKSAGFGSAEVPSESAPAVISGAEIAAVIPVQQEPITLLPAESETVPPQPLPEQPARTTIHFNCPGCGRAYQVPAAVAGRATKCRSCNTDMTVPMPAEVPAVTSAPTFTLVDEATPGVPQAALAGAFTPVAHGGQAAVPSVGPDLQIGAAEAARASPEAATPAHIQGAIRPGPRPTRPILTIVLGVVAAVVLGLCLVCGGGWYLGRTLTGNAGAGSADKFSDEGALKVEDFSIKSPGNGYRWQTGAALPSTGFGASSYQCKKGASPNLLSLLVYQKRGDSDGMRSTMLKAVWNAGVESFLASGCRVQSATKPSFATPIPDRVPFGFSGRRPDGSAFYLKGLMVFKKNTYAFQAVAGTTREADSLLAVAASLQEADEGTAAK
jgi:uncharacterized protein (DUF983 family)